MQFISDDAGYAVPGLLLNTHVCLRLCQPFVKTVWLSCVYLLLKLYGKYVLDKEVLSYLKVLVLNVPTSTKKFLVSPVFNSTLREEYPGNSDVAYSLTIFIRFFVRALIYTSHTSKDAEKPGDSKTV